MYSLLIIVGVVFISREGMIPEFVSKEVAEKVVSSGKGINFLAEVCHEMDLLIRCGDHVHAKLLNTSCGFTRKQLVLYCNHL